MTVHAPIQADFRYGDAGRTETGLSLSISIFADRGHLRDAIRDDALAAGLNIREAASMAVLREGAARPLGDVVIVDCPELDAATMAALVRLDMRAANSGARLIASTTLDALDDLFGCLDMSAPLLLVNPSRGERMIALGQVLAHDPGSRLRELSEEDALMLLRLTEQVTRLAERMDRLSGEGAGTSVFRFETPTRDFSGRGEDGERLVRRSRPPLPDPRLVRRIIRQRQLRARFFDGELFADPAWDMLLDLTAARAEHTRVSVTSLCIASGVPPTTALRWIGQMTEAGLFERIEDESDRRRAFIALTEKAADAMASYFAELGRNASRLI